MLAARKGKLLVGNVFVVLVCVRLREVCLIDAASTNWLSLGKMNLEKKNTERKRG